MDRTKVADNSQNMSEPESMKKSSQESEPQVLTIQKIRVSHLVGKIITTERATVILLERATVSEKIITGRASQGGRNFTNYE